MAETYRGSPIVSPDDLEADVEYDVNARERFLEYEGEEQNVSLKPPREIEEMVLGERIPWEKVDYDAGFSLDDDERAYDVDKWRRLEGGRHTFNGMDHGVTAQDIHKLIGEGYLQPSSLVMDLLSLGQQIMQWNNIEVFYGGALYDPEHSKVGVRIYSINIVGTSIPKHVREDLEDVLEDHREPTSQCEYTEELETAGGMDGVREHFEECPYISVPDEVEIINRCWS